MVTQTPKPSKSDPWKAINVRQSTLRALEAIRSKYCRRHGRPISQDAATRAAFENLTVDQLPTPAQLRAKTAEPIAVTPE